MPNAHFWSHPARLQRLWGGCTWVRPHQAGPGQPRSRGTLSGPRQQHCPRGAESSPGRQEVAALHSPAELAALRSSACSAYRPPPADLFFQPLRGEVIEAKRLQTPPIPPETSKAQRRLSARQSGAACKALLAAA